MPAALPPLALYVHMPWCVRKCPYCDFNSHAAPESIPQAQYIDALLEDLAIDLQALRRAARSCPIFFGGGTPSLFTPERVGRFLEGVRARMAFAPDIEVTLEANPGTVEHGRFAGYRDAGVNRVSLGAQTFDARAAAHARTHSRQRTTSRAPSRNCAAPGIDNFNLDLMYGLPRKRCRRRLRDRGRGARARADAHFALSADARARARSSITGRRRCPNRMRSGRCSWLVRSCSPRAATSSTRSRLMRGRTALPAQPQLLAVRRLPRHRRRRARQADVARERGASAVGSFAPRASSSRVIPVARAAADRVSDASQVEADGPAVRVHVECAAADRRLRRGRFRSAHRLAVREHRARRSRRRSARACWSRQGTGSGE